MTEENRQDYTGGRRCVGYTLKRGGTKMLRKNRSTVILVLLVLMCMLPFHLFAQGKQESAETGPTTITLWFHGGTNDETEAMKAQIARFNASQTEYQVVMTEIPGGAVAGSGYNDSVNAAALAGKLPDILELDGPNLYNYAWGGYLYPLDDLISSELKADILPSLIDQGTYDDMLYSLGQYDSGLALVGRKSLMQKAGVRIPTSIKDAWTLKEFNDVLDKLQNLSETEYAIDMKVNYGPGEWFSYAYSPVLQSFGGDLIDRTTYKTAEGVLNGKEAVRAMTWLQDLFQKGYATLTPPDDNEFINGKAALGFLGHWVWNGYRDQFGDDVQVIPMPKFGEKAVTGMGSWTWSISSQSKHPEGAWAFLEFILQPQEILSITNINGAIPGRNSALALSDQFGEGAPLDIFAQQLKNGVAVPRPKTPAYPVITVAFYSAFDNIIKGGNVQNQLDKAVDTIDADIKNNNY